MDTTIPLGHPLRPFKRIPPLPASPRESFIRNELLVEVNDDLPENHGIAEPLCFKVRYKVKYDDTSTTVRDDARMALGVF